MKKNIFSVSFGKDSLAMLLKCIELNFSIDEVVFVDTGMEFQAIYNIRDKIKPILKEKNIQYTELKFDKPFEYYMFDHIKRSGEQGYSWCGGRCRWGTTKKIQLLENHSKGHFQYIGIAYDEPRRIKTGVNNKIYPLFKLRMTEKDCLEYCYSNGFNWDEGGVELYDVLDRVSCWCCANKNLKELENYRKFLPDYWKRIVELQKRTPRLMKKSIKYKEWLSEEGINIFLNRDKYIGKCKAAVDYARENIADYDKAVNMML